MNAPDKGKRKAAAYPARQATAKKKEFTKKMKNSIENQSIDKPMEGQEYVS